MNIAWSQRAVTPLITGLVLLLVGPAGLAQGVYKRVTPDGQVIYTDQPAPTAQPAGGRSPANRSADAQTGDSRALPFELRQALSRFPVTLYAGDNCEPCASGRQLLQGRGIPFRERTIQTPEDAQALKRLSGASTLPVLTIGQQQLKGFSSQEWTQFLDAAGYPASSQLPRNYRPAEPSPLAPVSTPVPSGAAASGAASPLPSLPPPPAPPVVTPDNPAGIRF